jgi:hypothetical protein
MRVAQGHALRRALGSTNQSWISIRVHSCSFVANSFRCGAAAWRRAVPSVELFRCGAATPGGEPALQPACLRPSRIRCEVILDRVAQRHALWRLSAHKLRFHSCSFVANSFRCGAAAWRRAVPSVELFRCGAGNQCGAATPGGEPALQPACLRLSRIRVTLDRVVQGHALRKLSAHKLRFHSCSFVANSFRFGAATWRRAMPCVELFRCGAATPGGEPALQPACLRLGRIRVTLDRVAQRHALRRLSANKLRFHSCSFVFIRG